MRPFAISAEELRQRNIRDIMDELGALCILDPDAPPPAAPPAGHTVLVVHLYYMDLLAGYLPYLAAVPEDIDLVLTTNDEARAAEIRTASASILARHAHAEVRVCAPRGRELSALFLGCRDLFDRYDIIGFLHDKKSIRATDADGSVGATFSRLLWDSILGGSASYIRQAVDTFHRNPQIGLLVPYPPTHGIYLAVSRNFWAGCYAPARAILERVGIQVPTDPGITPVSLGSAFWARTSIFRRFLDVPWTLDDFPPEPMPINDTFSHALERIFPYLAQDAGFLTSFVAPVGIVRRDDLRFRRMYYETKDRLDAAEALAAQREADIDEIFATASWRITSPLRALSRCWRALHKT